MRPSQTPIKSPKYLSLLEGDSDGFIKISRISEELGEVELLTDGMRMILTLKSDSIPAVPLIASPVPDRDAVPPRKFAPISAGSSANFNK